VVRPLLFTTRAEVLAYLRRRKVRCRQDATNVTEDYLRNRVRHELIPLLEKRYNRRVQEAVLRLAQIAGIEHGFVEDEAARRVRKAHPQWAQGALVAERVALQRMPDALLPVAMRQLIELAGAGLQPMTMEHYVRVARLVKSPRSGQEAQLPGGVSIHVGRDRLAIARRPARLRRVPAREVLLPVPGEARLPDGRTIRTEEAPGGARRLRRFLAAKTAFEEMLDADEVAPPLRVRGFVKGDRFRPLGSRGRKKLSDFFTDEGVPRGNEDGSRSSAIGAAPSGSSGCGWTIA
jgi:tRNA(Ile)-lysidine synthase